MRTGASIFLIALGAILAFAVHADVGWLDLNVVGFVLILAGAAGLTLRLIPRHRTTRVVKPTGEEIVRDEEVRGWPE
jgi:hypothetical protein